MNFEYNSDKSKNNKNKHDIDFEQAKTIWNEDNIIIPALTTDEQRYMIIGKIKNKFYSCIFTMQGEKIRIISCRRSRPKEERMYHEKIY